MDYILDGMKMDTRNGLSTSWYKNGEMEYKGTFKDGKIDGLSTGWYDNGQKKREDTFKDGKHISQKIWNKDGSVKKK